MHQKNRSTGQWVRAVGALLLACGAFGAFAEPPFVRNGVAGFVVADLEYALAEDAEITGACPDGMSLNLAEIYARTPAGQRRDGESETAYGDRLKAAAGQLGTAPDGRNLCMYPEIAAPDTHFRTVERDDIPVPGIDLDGAVSTGDFIAPDGAAGVDNQFYRVVGCARSFQSSGLSNEFTIEMLSGAWAILIDLSGVDDIRNDDAVTVGLYASADPIDVNANRKALAYATYAMDQDPRFRATASGRIRDGVLTTEPVDVRFHTVVNSLRLERPLDAARLQATLAEDGTLSGYLAGFTPVEELYDYQFGYRNGRGGDGELAPEARRAGTANGAAFVLGHTCHGVYQALQRHADAEPDPVTGHYTAISTQYRFEAIPAFLVDIETRSTNAELAAGKGGSHAP
ncbi:hypothetical protein [Mangrovimicrobium sediminis]|uniref:hypothetical protein n=1 Tax=Mangrovimicrobium sediminis TaxID=2562682 RepID=UPI0014368EEF|nr:hypothetical protein [Haliea sp. SAOS-164]